MARITLACIFLALGGFFFLLVTLFYNQYQAFAQWLLSRQDVLIEDLRRVIRWLGFSKVARLLFLIAGIWLIMSGLQLLKIL